VRLSKQELTDAACWMFGEEPGDGRLFEEWGASRDIDLEALRAHAAEELGTLTALLPASISAESVGRLMFLQGFVTGIEAERRRRDRAELPE
jgi:hypothetical protein